MRWQNRRYRYFIPFIGCLILLCTAPLISAQAIEKPLLTWLPLLTAKLQLIQPNQHCPQNKITNIQLNKKSDSLDADIAAVDWDLNCTTAHPMGMSAEQLFSLPEQKDNLDLQVQSLFNLLESFPEANIHVKSLNLQTDFINSKLALTGIIKKRAESVFITLSGKPLHIELHLNLTTKQLNIESSFTLEELEDFITIPDQFKALWHNELKIRYVSDLAHWEKGSFSIDLQGRFAGLAEQGELTMVGDLALLTQQIQLKKMLFNFTNVTHKISSRQELKTAYIRAKLVEPASINLSSLSCESLPLQLRVGRSVLLTKVPRGKSQRIRTDRQKLPPLFASIKAQGGVGNLLFDWRLSLLNQTLFGKLWYAQNKLKVELQESPLTPQTLVESLRSYLPDLQLLEISSGEINLQLSADYDLHRRAASVKSRINAIDIAGKNDSVLFDGVTLNSSLDFQYEKQKLIINQDKQQLKIANLFIGVPIQALQLDTQLNAGELVIEHFKARLLGGRVDFDDFKLTPPSQTLINLSGLSLGEVIKYSAYPEIKSKAIIDGVLPLSLTEQGPVIKQGMVFARYPGGYIKVPENTVVKTMGRRNPAFSFTMQVLSNLQFDTLQGVIDYAADGESVMKIQIKGKNPEVSGSQPVTFNYSHNENILKLLKSLRFNEQLIKQIEERY